MSAKLQSDYLRSIIFGVEDGLVSTTGAVVGISVGSANPRLVVLAGLVIVAVEAVSMAAGEFVTEETIHELEPGKHTDSLWRAAGMMFISYLAAGLIPVLPFLFLSLVGAAVTSIILAFISLFLLGYFKARITRVRPVRSGLQILAIGGFATLIGVAVGLFLKI